MRKARLGLWVFVVLLVFAQNVSAEISVQRIEDEAVPSGYVANELVWGGGLDRFSSAAIRVDMTSGSVFNHPIETGSGGPPAPLFFNAFPRLEFDTSVGPRLATEIFDGAAELGGGPLSQDTPQISLSWANSLDVYDDAVDYLRIGMITLSDDAMGSFQFYSVGQLISGPVINGVLVPEPASGVLLGLACMALIRRR